MNSPFPVAPPAKKYSRAHAEIILHVLIENIMLLFSFKVI